MQRIEQRWREGEGGGVVVWGCGMVRRWAKSGHFGLGAFYGFDFAALLKILLDVEPIKCQCGGRYLRDYLIPRNIRYE